LIISYPHYDTVRKFQAVLKTANVTEREYSMIPMPLVEVNGRKIITSAGNSVFSPIRAYVEDSRGIREVNITGG
jgi:hypothetical protein